MENVAVDSKVDSLNFRCRRQAVALHNPPPYVMQMPTNLYKFYLVRIIRAYKQTKTLVMASSRRKTRGKRPEQFPETGIGFSTREEFNVASSTYFHILIFQFGL